MASQLQHVNGLQLEELTQKVNENEDSGAIKLHFNTGLGRCSLLTRHVTTREHAVSAFVAWASAAEAFPKVDMQFSFAFNAVKGAQRRVLAEWLGLIKQATSSDPYIGHGVTGLLEWPDLRAAVAQGFRLQASVFVASSEPIGPTDRLRVEPSGGSDFRPFRGTLPCDVTLRAGGREFPAHRAVLAAASPVWLASFGGGMAEAGAAAVDVGEACPEALALLIDHAYGATIEVPLALAVQLYGLADRYQLHSDLAQQLLLWLGAARVAPEALCELLPAADALCPLASAASLYRQAAAALSPSASAVFCGWPVGLVCKVLPYMAPSKAWDIAVAWVQQQQQQEEEVEEGQQQQEQEQQQKKRQKREGQPMAPQQSEQVAADAPWPQLLGAIAWASADHATLCTIAAAANSQRLQVPGLYERLFWALDTLHKKLQAGVVAAGAG